MKTPKTPFCTRLSGSAKETELRIRNIFQWKKKRPPVVLFVLTAALVLSCFGLVSCENDADKPSVNDPVVETTLPAVEKELDVSPSPSNEGAKTEREKAMELFSAILDGSGEFVSAESGMVLTIARIKEEVTTAEGVALTVPTFAVVDLDGDGVEELVLTLVVNDSNQYGSEILRYHEGTVYGYTAWARAMYDLKTDGTYSVSSGAFDHGVCTMEFREDGWHSKLLAESRSVIMADGGIDAEYYVNGAAATYEDLAEAYRKQRGKEDVRWYDLTCGWGRDLSKQPYVFMVENNISEEYRVYEPMAVLTQAQKALLADLPVAEMPKEAVEPGRNTRSDFWRDTLLPMVYDEEADVTLYGVVGADALQGFKMTTTLNRQDQLSDGIVLRVGNRAAYYPFSWHGDHWYNGNSRMTVVDTDGDGRKDAAAVMLWAGRGVGVRVDCLYLINLDDLTYQTVDFSRLNIQVWCNPVEKIATLTCGDSRVTVDTSDLDNVTHCTAMNQVQYYVEAGRIDCYIGLDFYGVVAYLANAEGTILFSDTGPYFGNITLR